MAELLIGSFQVLTNLGSGVDAGDRILCYWDDSAEDLVIKHFDVSAASTSTITSGPSLGYHSILNLATKDHTYLSNMKIVYLNIISGKTPYYGISNSSFCNGTTYNYFTALLSNPVFPYVTRNETPNAAQCVLQVCDIRFTAPAEVTNAGSQTGNDGQIVVLAESQNGTVKYSLTDFTYSTGGQTSGTFSGLSPGDYTIYAKDTYGCSTTLSVTVEIEDEYSELFYIQYDEVFDTRVSKFRIYERGYVGDATELTYSNSEPLQISKIQKSNDKLNVIEFTKAILNLVSTVDFEFLNLFTQDDKKFKGVWEVDGTPKWTGFIVPSVFNEPYLAAPYATQFELTDGLKDLESIKFTNDDGTLLFGSNKIIKLIAFLLKKTKLSLNIRVACNIYETNHTSAATDDPLDQTYIDYTCFRNDKNEPFNCLQVLESVLKPFGARIYQWDNRWNISRFEEEFDSYDYRIYDSDGDYSSNGTHDPILNISSTEIQYANKDHMLEITPAYGVISVVNKLNKVSTLITGSFEKDDLLIPSDDTSGFKDWTLQLPDQYTAVSFFRGVTSDNSSVGAFVLGDSVVKVRNAYIQSKPVEIEYGPSDKLRISFDYGVDRISNDIPFIVLRFKIKIGTNYLQQDGSWDTTEYIYRNYPQVSNKLEKFTLTLSLPDVSVVTEQDMIVYIYPYFSRYPGETLPGTFSMFGDDLPDLRDFGTTSINTYKVDVKTSDSDGEYIDYYDLQLGTDAESVPTIIRPDDYDGATNKKVWELQYRRAVGSIFDVGSDSYENSVFVVDNFDVDILPNGQEPPEEELLSYTNNSRIFENLEEELYNADLPEVPVNNGKRNYNNYFRLSDGTPTSEWTRDAYTEARSLQRIYLEMLKLQYSDHTFKINGSFVNNTGVIIGLDNTLRITRTGDSVTLSNTTFTTDLTGWSNDGAGTSFAWSADYSGSAQVVLSGAASSSKKLTQGFVTTVPTNVTVTVDLQKVSTDDDREHRIIVVFYRNTSIIQSNLLATIIPQSTTQTYDIEDTVYLPSLVTSVGLYIQSMAGSDSVTFNVSEFSVVGVNSVEDYKISNYVLNDLDNIYNLELQLINSTSLPLSGSTGTSREHSSAYSTAYS